MRKVLSSRVAVRGVVPLSEERFLKTDDSNEEIVWNLTAMS